MEAENIVISFDTDTTQLESTISLLEKLGQVDKKTADEFRVASEKYKQSFSGLGDSASRGFAKINNEIKNIGTSLATSVVLDKSKDVVKTISSVISLREQIKQAIAQTAEFSAKFGELDSRTIAAAKNAAILKERFSDAQKTIASLNPEAKFTAFTQLGSVMAGAFQVATGALQAFGVESETATKLAQQFQGALNIAAGLNQLTNLKDALTNVKAALGITTVAAGTLSDSTISIAESTKDYNASLNVLKNTNDTYKLTLDKIKQAKEALVVANTAEASSAEGAAVATKSFTAALLTNPVFIAITAIAALSAAYVFLKEDIKDTGEELKKNAEIRGEVLRSTEKERIKIQLLIDEYRNNNTEQKRRIEIEQQLIEKAPEFFSKLDNELSKTDALTNAYRIFIEVSQKRAEAQILIGKIAELNAQRAVDEANGIEDNVKGIDKFTAAIFSVLNPGASAAIKIKSGTDGLAESIAKNIKETDTYTEVLNKLIKELDNLGFALDETKKQGDDRIDALKQNATKESAINDDRLKEKQALEYRLREIGISLIADEFEQRRQRLILAFDKEIDTYAEKLEKKKITLEQFNAIFNKLNEQLTKDTADVTKQGLIKAFADEEALRKDQTEKILKVIQDQNIVLQTDDLTALNERIKSKQDVLRSSGTDEVTIARETAAFINAELAKLNEKKLNDDLTTLENQRTALVMSGGDLVTIEKQIEDKKLEITQAGNKQLIDSDAEAAAKRKEIQYQVYQGLQLGLEIYGAINEITANFAEEQISQIESVRDAEFKSIEDRMTKNKENLDRRIISERAFKEQEKKLILEKENAEKQSQLRINEEKRKQDIADRIQKSFQIAIATARNVADQPGPYGSLIPFWIALGAAQLGIVISKPLPKYAKGTLNVAGRSGSGDSVHAMLTPGESVLPVDTTRAYHPTIKAVYNGSIPASEMNKWVKWRLRYPQGSTSTTAVSHMDIDYDKLAAKIGKEFEWAVRGRNKVSVSNLSELASMLNDVNDIRRR